MPKESYTFCIPIVQLKKCDVPEAATKQWKSEPWRSAHSASAMVMPTGAWVLCRAEGLRYHCRGSGAP